MPKKVWEGLNLAGVRFWTASLLPVLVGTTLPFWLRPPTFTFRILAAIEFLAATVFFHAGFSFLLAWFEKNHQENWSRAYLLKSAGFCVGISCLLGIHININLQLNTNVFEGIFLIYGFCALFVGLLYVVPPINFYRQVGGEIVISYSLGLLPLLGAYIIQAGDITRRVYLAALPVIAITGLWVWIDKMANYSMDKKSGRNSLVIFFGIRFSGQFGVLTISTLYIFTILLAVFSASVNPLALVSLLLVVFIWKIVNITWNNYSVLEKVLDARKIAIVVHFLTCIIIAITSMMINVSIPLPILSW